MFEEVKMNIPKPGKFGRLFSNGWSRPVPTGNYD